MRSGFKARKFVIFALFLREADIDAWLWTMRWSGSSSCSGVH